MSFEELHKSAVEDGRKKAEEKIDLETSQIKEILSNPSMIELFSGLERFDITEYRKVAARVRSDHLSFFLHQYLGREGVPVQKDADGLIGFHPPKRLLQEADRAQSLDPYEVRIPLTAERIERATPDKKLAQATLGSRLLRFGDPAFEAMIRHVQHGGFSDGVASLVLPSAALKLASGTESTWLLFDLRIVRQEASARILRSELASFLVPKGGRAQRADDLIEFLHEARDGDAPLDTAEVRRAYDAARAEADVRLRTLYDEVVAEQGSANDILPHEIQDVGLAWVRAG
jgi:hypothetical protein